MRESLTLRSRCQHVFPQPQFEPVWEVPSDKRWNPVAFAFHWASELCVRALVETLREDNPGFNCIGTDTIHLALDEKEIEDGGVIYEAREKEWVNELGGVIKRYNDAIRNDGMSVVIPFYVYFFDLKGEFHAAHVVIGVLVKSEKRGELNLYVFDGNGYIHEWHADMLKVIRDGLRDVRVFMDLTSPNMNFNDTSVHHDYLKRMGVNFPNFNGICAFLAYVLTAEFLCTGEAMFKKGHTLRLFRDLLDRDDDIDHMVPWEETVVIAYSLACAYRIMKLTVRRYPTTAQAVALGWDTEKFAYPEFLNYNEEDYEEDKKKKPARVVRLRKVHTTNGALRLEKVKSPS